MVHLKPSFSLGSYNKGWKRWLSIGSIQCRIEPQSETIKTITIEQLKYEIKSGIVIYVCFFLSWWTLTYTKCDQNVPRLLLLLTNWMRNCHARATRTIGNFVGQYATWHRAATLGTFPGSSVLSAVKHHLGFTLDLRHGIKTATPSSWTSSWIRGRSHREPNPAMKKVESDDRLGLSFAQNVLLQDASERHIRTRHWPRYDPGGWIHCAQFRKHALDRVCGFFSSVSVAEFPTLTHSLI